LYVGFIVKIGQELNLSKEQIISAKSACVVSSGMTLAVSIAFWMVSITYKYYKWLEYILILSRELTDGFLRTYSMHFCTNVVVFIVFILYLVPTS